MLLQSSPLPVSASSKDGHAMILLRSVHLIQFLY